MHHSFSTFLSSFSHDLTTQTTTHVMTLLRDTERRVLAVEGRQEDVQVSVEQCVGEMLRYQEEVDRLVHRNREEVERKVRRIAEELDKRDTEGRIGEGNRGKQDEGMEVMDRKWKEEIEKRMEGIKKEVGE